MYLDYAATSPISISVKEVVDQMIECYGNPSSLHTLGVASERKLKCARKTICDHLKVGERELIFTSGGTESNNLAILGSVDHRSSGRFITSCIEHPSVYNTMEHLSKRGFETVVLPVDKDGLVRVEDLNNALTTNTVLVSIMHVNNEVGSIQPVQAIGECIHQFNKEHRTSIRFHVDAVQSFGKMKIDVKRSHIDLMSISSHKINGLKGVGALYVRSGLHMKPLFYGGQQEGGARPGTENLLGILAFEQAVKDCTDRYQQLDQVLKIKNAFLLGLLSYYFDNLNFEQQPMDQLDHDHAEDWINTHIKHIENYVSVNGSLVNQVSPYILNLSFIGVKGEVLLHTLESKDIYISTGSACSSKKKAYSHVIQALTSDENRLEGSVRLSFHPDLDTEEVYETGKIVARAADELRRIMFKPKKKK